MKNREWESIRSLIRSVDSPPLPPYDEMMEALLCILYGEDFLLEAWKEDRQDDITEAVNDTYVQALLYLSQFVNSHLSIRIDKRGDPYTSTRYFDVLTEEETAQIEKGAREIGEVYRLAYNRESAILKSLEQEDAPEHKGFMAGVGGVDPKDDEQLDN